MVSQALSRQRQKDPHKLENSCLALNSRPAVLRHSKNDTAKKAAQGSTEDRWSRDMASLTWTPAGRGMGQKAQRSGQRGLPEVGLYPGHHAEPRTFGCQSCPEERSQKTDETV